jgi:hypothetical protein
MDQFRTEVTPPEFPFSINHGSRISLIGSCFTENMGARLIENKIDVSVNPFGILFNPFAIMNALERMLNNRRYTPDELMQVGEHWVSLDHHGRFNGPDAEQVCNAINAALEEGAAQLLRADAIFITLGSAWIYEHVDSQHIVANCHKIPNKAFKKRLLTQQEVHLILRHIPDFLKAKGIDANVVFTVSPVRHWKDGAVENQRSKAQLISAVHQVVDAYEQCHYFPAYEMQMDDLRDYRFYANDMLHPNSQAIDYIWEGFQQSFFDDETRIICQELKAVVQAAAHRPVDPESNAFQRFVKKQLEIIAVLEKRYPTVDLSAERAQFEAYAL